MPRRPRPGSSISWRRSRPACYHLINRMPPIFLVGPTACGKSAVALELAGKLGADIVSADSMQVYRGMDIGTAKVKGQHLVDVCDVSELFDVKRYITLAQSQISILKSVIIVGG